MLGGKRETPGPRLCAARWKALLTHSPLLSIQAAHWVTCPAQCPPTDVIARRRSVLQPKLTPQSMAKCPQTFGTLPQLAFFFFLRCACYGRKSIPSKSTLNALSSVCGCWVSVSPSPRPVGLPPSINYNLGLVQSPLRTLHPAPRVLLSCKCVQHDVNTRRPH